MKRPLFKVGCLFTAIGLVCSKFPQTAEFTTIFGFVALAILLIDAIDSILYPPQ